MNEINYTLASAKAREKRQQMSNWIIQLLSRKPLPEKQLVKNIYILCNEIVPHSLLIELANKNLIMLRDDKWVRK